MTDAGYIGGVGGPGGIQPIRPHEAPGTKPAEGGEFGNVLADSIREIEQLQAAADRQIAGLVTGEVTNVGEAMVAVERANMAFRTMMEIRNKILTAYEELQRMPL